MNIKKSKVKDLKFFPGNPRKMDHKTLEQLKTSIREFGMVQPLIINEKNQVIGGNQRLQALRELGIEEVDTVQVHLPEAKQKALNLALNKISGEWDEDLLQKFIDDMPNEDIEIAGFDLKELGIDLDDLGLVEEDEYKGPTEPRVQPALGDMYQLGEHKLICGDSTKQETYERLLGDEKADMVFTDPPYNVNYKSRGALGSIKNDDMSEEEFINFTLNFMQQVKDHLKTGGVYYICSGYSSYPAFIYGIHALGLEFSGPIIWVKNQTSMGWNDYRHKYEIVLAGKKKQTKSKKGQPILYGWNGGAHYFAKDPYESDVWEVPRRGSNTMIHPTQKPVPLIARAIKNSSRPGEIILDPFGGSGSTLIAAEKTKRKARIIELDPHYAGLIIERWEDLTGKKAVKIT